MSHTRKDRREFLKRFGISAAAMTAAPAYCAGQSQAGQSRAARKPASRRKSELDQHKTDVLVVGGGPAGIGAALGAARQGADVLLIENQAFFGGVAAWCLGMPINQMRPAEKPRSEVHELILDKLLALGDQAVRIGDHQLFCNVDYLKVAVLDALDETGCKYLVHTRAVDTVVENNRVTGVVVSTKNGLATIHAKAVVDCTGDADIAYYAGAETMKEVGELSPNTLCLNLGNVTQEQVREAKVGEIGKKAKQKYPLVPERWGISSVGNSHHFFINHAGTRDLGQFDTTDAWQRSKAECLSRKQVVQMTEAMREFGGDQLKDIELVGAGTQIGVRETRRVKGGYILTEEDAMQGRQFDDAIAWRSGHLDIGFVRLTRMKIHDVPYRSIVPLALDGLLMAGRCISATHVAASAGKSMGNCVATGHAAGIAASMSAKSGKAPVIYACPRFRMPCALMASTFREEERISLHGCDEETRGFRADLILAPRDETENQRGRRLLVRVIQNNPSRMPHVALTLPGYLQTFQKDQWQFRLGNDGRTRSTLTRGERRLAFLD